MMQSVFPLSLSLALLSIFFSLVFLLLSSVDDKHPIGAHVHARLANEQDLVDSVVAELQRNGLIIARLELDRLHGLLRLIAVYDYALDPCTRLVALGGRVGRPRHHAVVVEHEHAMYELFALLIVERARVVHVQLTGGSTLLKR